MKTFWPKGKKSKRDLNKVEGSLSSENWKPAPPPQPSVWVKMVFCMLSYQPLFNHCWFHPNLSPAKKCTEYPFSKHVCNSLDSGKTETFWSGLFSVFLFLLIHLVSKATGSNIVFLFIIIFIAGRRRRKAQVHGQTWVSIKRDFLISEILYSMFGI